MAFVIKNPPDGLSKLLAEVVLFAGSKFRADCADRMAAAALKLARHSASNHTDPWGKKWRPTKEDKKRGHKKRPALPGMASTLDVRAKGSGFELFSSDEHAILHQKTRRVSPKAYTQDQRKWLGMLVHADKLRKMEAEENKRQNGGKYKRSPWRLPARPIFPVYGKPVPEGWTKAMEEAAARDGLQE